MKAQTLRKLRPIIQILFFVGFLVLSLFPGHLNPQRVGAGLFFYLDPLAALAVSLASRALVAGMWLALFTVLLTLLFGRAWCGWICPLGTLLEWFSPRKSKVTPPPAGWRKAKYVLLAVMLAAALFGNLSLLFLDPITIWNRVVAAAVWPGMRAAIYGLEAVLYTFEPLWGVLDAVHGAVVAPVFGDVQPAFEQAVPVFLFLVVVVALNVWAERFWCRYLCPLGGLLGLLSRFSWVRRSVGEGCSACGLCSRHCPTGTIDPRQGYRSDPAECTVCLECVADCPRQETRFQPQVPFKLAPAQSYDPGRRDCLAAVGAAAVGVALTGAEAVQKQKPAFWLRPPGANLAEFDALCLRCGACVRVCPTQGLQVNLLEGGWQNWMTPRLVPRLGYCNFGCNACGEVCPSGAIPRLSLPEKQHTPLGLARVDKNRCLPWAYGIPCIVCEEMCPVENKAIHLEVAEINKVNGERLSVQRPYVVKERCIGCGICEFKCPMGGEAAIRVFTPTEAGGYQNG